MFKGLFGKPKPVTPVTTPLLAATAAPVKPIAVPAGGFDQPSAPGTIKDVTLRPVVLGINKT